MTRFMNEFDVEDALIRFDTEDTPNRRRAAENLYRLMEWTNRHSDGWAYWPKPSRSAAKLIDLLTGDDTYATLQRLESEDCTDAELTAALAPIKAMLTRVKAEHPELIIR